MKKALRTAAAAALKQCLCASAHAEEAQRCRSGDFGYILLIDGSAEIMSYTGGAETLDIPPQLDGHAVTGAGPFAFSERGSLRSVTIPDSVTSIGKGIFSHCGSLTAVIAARGSFAAQYCQDNSLPCTCTGS